MLTHVHSIQSGRIDWPRRAVQAFVATGLLIAHAASAQQQQAYLMVDYVAPSVLMTNAEAQFLRLNIDLGEAMHDMAAVAPSPSTPQRRWQEFEAEFGIQEKDPSFFRGSLQGAKYKLDETLFAAQELLDSMHYEATLKEMMGGNSGAGSSRHSFSDSSQSWLDTAKFRSGVDLNRQTGRPFVGMQLELKFGD